MVYQSNASSPQKPTQLLDFGAHSPTPPKTADWLLLLLWLFLLQLPTLTGWVVLLIGGPNATQRLVVVVGAWPQIHHH